MAEESRSFEQVGWQEASGLSHIFRVLGFAVNPTKLVLALSAILMTLLSGAVLDLIWKTGSGVGPQAIAEYIVSTQSGTQYQESKGESGIFEVWRRHTLGCLSGPFDPGIESHAPAAAGDAYPGGYGITASIWSPISGVGYGVLWIMTQHPVYFVIIAIDLLLIWSWAGGCICRISAVEMARGDRPTLKQVHKFTMKRLIGGFAMAPCVPLIGILIIVVLMVIGGMLLRVPVLGDFVAGTAFPLAVLGGFITAMLLVGLLIGGSLFWPAIAAEGQDAYDAFSRGLSYAFSKPWKTVLYAAIAIVFGWLCWTVVRAFTLLGLVITRSVVAFGTSPLGWWQRSTVEGSTSKLELLWRSAGPGARYSWPNWSELSWYEYYSAVVIWLCVALVILLMWAFLCSFYFCSSTVVYFLLRRDVDKSELDEVMIEEEPGDDGQVVTAGQAPEPVGAPAPEVTGQPSTSSEPTPAAGSVPESPIPGSNAESEAGTGGIGASGSSKEEAPGGESEEGGDGKPGEPPQGGGN